MIKPVLAARKITLHLNILNLVYNARDAMPAGGTLTLLTYDIEEMIVLEVTDTGCGMSPELQTRVFEPFMTAGKPHGTGMGMAIVKDIIDAHQGQITVESDIGKGTTIRLQLPRL